MRAALVMFVAVAGLALAPSALAGPATPSLTVESRTASLAPLSAAAKKPRVALKSLRACTKAAYRASTYTCLRDERARPFVAEAAICTVTIYAYSAVTVRAKMLFAGGTQFTHTRKLKKRTRFQFAFGLEFPITMPAGAYTCQFTVGPKKASATMRSAGPAGPLVSAAVCTSALLSADGTGCSADQSASPFLPASAISCTTWLVGQQGKKVTMDFWFNDNGTWTRIDGIEVAPTKPIVPAWMTLPSLRGAPFTPGQYACRYSVAGQALGEKLFSVA